MEIKKPTALTDGMGVFLQPLRGMGKEILCLVSVSNQLLSIIRLLLSEDGFIRFTRLCDDNVVKNVENDYEKISSSLPSSRHDSFSFNADLC
ncbi:hypothetical protein KKJ13_20240 [Xenorhabdus bovienii]|uniref:hypothetical protein n=1 Tax=Xenorhabdus bovienii TaxID=40576 RepID=UPI0023B356DD|nr:hypothetical protein [Xenorhabdus bovienii]MDE9443850.1 hypothetical protein [Xenorhabdus bovienii]